MRRHGVQEDGLAVLAGTVDEDQGVFLHRSAEAIAAELLKEPDQLRIVACHFAQERQEARAIRRLGWRDQRHLGDGVGRIGRAQEAGAQVDGPSRRPEQHRIAVPMVRRDRERPVDPREPLHASGEARLAVAAFRGCVFRQASRKLPRPFQREPGAFLAPVRAGPAKPSARVMIEAQLVVMQPHEVERGAVLGDLGSGRERGPRRRGKRTIFSLSPPSSFMARPQSFTGTTGALGLLDDAKRGLRTRAEPLDVPRAIPLALAALCGPPS